MGAGREHFPYNCDPDEVSECRFSCEKTACSVEVSPYTNREMLSQRPWEGSGEAETLRSSGNLGDAGGVAVAVAIVGRGAGRVMFLRRGDCAYCQASALRVPLRSGAGGLGGRDDASGRGRAGVLRRPRRRSWCRCWAATLLANVLNGGDGDGLAVGAFAVGDGLAAGVDAGAVGGAGDGLGPGEQVRGLFGEQAAAVFLIEEEDGARGKAFALGGGDGGGGVLAGERGGWFAGLLGAENLFVEAAVGDDEEAEAVAQEDVALADPGIVRRRRAGW